MATYIEHVMSLVHQLADIGRVVEDKEVAEILLSGLPADYDTLVSNLETYCISSEELKSDLVRTRLLQEAQRKSANNGSSTTAYITSKIKCTYCHRVGHIKPKCFKYKKDRKQRDSSKSATATAAFFAQDRTDVFLDSGASSHLSNDPNLLSNIRDTKKQSISLANSETMSSSKTGDLSVALNGQDKNLKNCEACIKGKLSAEPFPKASNSTTTQPLQLVHTDVCGPMPETSHGGGKYLLTFTDDYSRKSFAYIMKNKSQVFDCFKHFKAMVEKEKSLPILCLRSDNGGEFTSSKFTQYLKEHGIIHQTTIPYCSAQNGVAEMLKIV
ncbi:uncharacterized protein LOC133525334 [Cydia pomonella]|uniref:uncharacterized protein LOC133525334 n=1 Tax=Cydia pomonella TaxID=82600 RepID=UPI002ADE235D|nr:uncharacterized protein LOC133525334 [Cydia pomonella]